jgi:hypothetical protein
VIILFLGGGVWDSGLQFEAWCAVLE